MFYKIIVFSSTYTLTLLIKWIQTPRQASTQVNDSMKFTSRLQINLYNKHSSQLFTWTLVTANTQKKSENVVMTKLATQPYQMFYWTFYKC